MQNQWQVAISSTADVVTARQSGRALAMELGFDGSDLTLIATAISEVARNIVEHATCGEIVMGPSHRGHQHGISIVARDHGPGIADVEQAMQFGFSTSRSLGAGLPGAKALMDEFSIDSKVGHGTTVTMAKWRPQSVLTQCSKARSIRPNEVAARTAGHGRSAFGSSKEP